MSVPHLDKWCLVQYPHTFSMMLFGPLPFSLQMYSTSSSSEIFLEVSNELGSELGSRHSFMQLIRLDGRTQTRRTRAASRGFA